MSGERVAALPCCGEQSKVAALENDDDTGPARTEAKHAAEEGQKGLIVGSRGGSSALDLGADR